MLAILFPAAIPIVHASQEGTGGAATSGFVPLDRWKAAVLAGDQPSLKLLYIASPQSYAITPQGKINDPGDEESQFWSALHGQGLTAVSAKILERGQPEPGVEQMVLRIELTFEFQGKTQRQVIGGVQVWGQVGTDWRILVSQRTESGALPSMRLPEPATPNIHLYSEPSDATKELDEALASAKSDHKRVLVVFGANWCYDCHVLEEAMNSGSPRWSLPTTMSCISISEKEKTTRRWQIVFWCHWRKVSPALRLSMPPAKLSPVKSRENLNPQRKSG
jgi:hypothetical protein